MPEGLRGPSGPAGERRLAVYRNNIMASLIEALGDQFPVCRRLVGEEFFRALARAHAANHKPATPILAQYGDGFAGWLQHWLADWPEDAEGLDFLPDMARLEWLWLGTYHASDETAFTLADLQQVPPGQLESLRPGLHPAVRRLTSRWPVGSLWLAHREAEPDLAGVPDQAERVVITRPAAEVHLSLLGEGEWQVLDLIAEGLPLGQIMDHATEQDVGAALVRLIAIGALKRPQGEGMT